MFKTDLSLCQYNQLANGVHEIIMLEVSHLAVDEMFALSDRILNNIPMPHTEPTLLDSRIGTQPLGYSFTKMRAFSARHAKRDTGRIAFLMEDRTLWRALAVFMRPFGTTRIFMPDERDQALAWLIADRPAPLTSA